MPPLFNFTLNCVICFDPFDEKEHYPVILPCGHTFVCHECASRLDNCHECRRSLFVEPKQATSIVNAVPSSTGANAMIPPVLSDDDDASDMPKWYKPLPPRPSAGERHGIHSLRKKKAKAPQEVALEPIRLPLPKNLVLMEMIGVANAKIKRGQVDEDQCVDSTAKESITALTSECGTYVVKDTLQILKERTPEMEGAIASRSKTVVGVKSTDRDDMSRKSLGIRKTLSARKKKKPDSPNNKKSSPRRTKRYGRKGSKPHSFDGEDERDALSSNASIIPPEIGQLEPGDYIHVVAYDNGIAKLARRRGYVRARPEQLVKVAGPQDDVVAIEGQLCAMIKQRKVCLQDLVDMKKERTKLLLRLKLAILEEETRKTEGADLLLESLDEHYKTPDVPKELLRQSSALPERSPHRSSPQCVSEIRIDSNNDPRGVLPPPPPPPAAPTTPPPNMPSLEQEEDDDLGKQAAKIEAIRREYESASFFCCLE